MDGRETGKKNKHKEEIHVSKAKRGGDRSKECSENTIAGEDLPIKRNRYSHQEHSSVFDPLREKDVYGTCFKMEGAHPSMPYTFDGCGILAQAELRGWYGGRSQNL